MRLWTQSLFHKMCIRDRQRAASISPNITGEMIDLMHYPELKSKYKVMSVPCMIINNQDVYFGKKNLEEITGILEEKGIS